MASLTLPPMKGDPLNLSVPSSGSNDRGTKQSSRSAAKTPTRIPLPVARTPRQSGSDDDQGSLSGSDSYYSLSKPSKNTSNTDALHHHHSNTAKVGPTTTVYSGSMIVSSSSTATTSHSRYPLVEKPSVSTTARSSAAAKGKSTASSRKVASSYSTSSTTASSSAAPRLRKPTVISGTSSSSSSSKVVTAAAGSSSSSGNVHRRCSLANDLVQDQMDKEKYKAQALAANLVSAHGVISPPESVRDRKPEPRRRPTLLHERLQGLVEESRSSGQGSSSAWSSLVEREQQQEEQEQQQRQITVIRGRGGGAAVGSSNGRSSRASDNSSPENSKEKGGGVRAPMSPQTALKLYHSCLSPFERSEILDYPQIFFVGNHAQKRQATIEQQTCNHGYDDERGDYHIVLRDHLGYRYEVLEVLGRGSFGQVLKCYDHKTGQTTAVKMIRNKKRFHTQALVEVKILSDLIRWVREIENVLCNTTGF